MGDKNYGQQQQATSAQTISKLYFDPVFANLKVVVPRNIEGIFKAVESISFMYELANTDYIKLIDITTEKTLLSIFFSSYETFPFEEAKLEGISFIFGREAYRNRYKTERNKKYKEAFEKNLKFIEKSGPKDMQMKYLKYQIYEKANFVFIDDAKALHTHLRSLASLVRVEDRYVPKTKKFAEEDKEGFLRCVLEGVPGVSPNISRAIVERFKTVNSFVAGLLDREEFMKIKITDENNGVRNMPEKVYLKLFKGFCGEFGDEKI